MFFVVDTAQNDKVTEAPQEKPAPETAADANATTATASTEPATTAADTTVTASTDSTPAEGKTDTKTEDAPATNAVPACQWLDITGVSASGLDPSKDAKGLSDPYVTPSRLASDVTPHSRLCLVCFA